MAEPKETARGGRRWVKWLLVLSLGLNLFVAAVVIGAAVSHHRDARHWRSPDIGFGPFTEILTREDRVALRDAFLAAAPDFRDRRREAREDFGRLAKALRAEPWDRSAVEAIIEEQSDRTVMRMDLGRRLLSERVAGMSPEARQALADRIEAAMARHWRR